MNLVNEQINVCARWLQEEELAVSYISKRHARAEYEREYKILQRLKKRRKRA